jgi:hypothetical protein
MSAAPEAGRKAAGGVLAAACVSALVVNVNTSAVTILLPSISEDVGAPVAELQWAVTGYSLVGAAERRHRPAPAPRQRRRQQGRGDRADDPRVLGARCQERFEQPGDPEQEGDREKEARAHAAATRARRGSAPRGRAPRGARSACLEIMPPR